MRKIHLSLLTSILCYGPLSADQVGSAAAEGASQATQTNWKTVSLIAGIFAFTVATVVLVSKYNSHH